MRTDIPLETYVAVVQTTPRRPGENWVRYVERIAVLAGGLRVEDAALHDPKKTEWFDAGTVLRKSEPVGVMPEGYRAPYRDADEEEAKR